VDNQVCERQLVRTNGIFCIHVHMMLYILVCDVVHMMYFRANSEYTQISLPTCCTIFIFIMYIVYNIYYIVYILYKWAG